MFPRGKTGGGTGWRARRCLDIRGSPGKRLPGLEFALNPLRSFLCMTEHAGIGAVLLAKAQCHFRIGYVVNLVRTCAEEQRVHDGGHVAGDAAAGLGVEGMMGVRRSAGLVLKLSVAANAHKVRLIFEFQRGIVGREIVAVRVMTGAASDLALAEALRALKSLDHKGSLSYPAVLEEGLTGKFAQG